MVSIIAATVVEALGCAIKPFIALNLNVAGGDVGGVRDLVLVPCEGGIGGAPWLDHGAEGELRVPCIVAFIVCVRGRDAGVQEFNRCPRCYSNQMALGH